MSFSAKTRNESIDQLKSTELDVLIIGGGVTGAGLALQGSARGMKTGLIEMEDFSSGTSSRSTKLVHGGLRYLKQFEVELVANIAQERSVIQHLAPHIVEPEYLVMPVYDEPGASFNDFSSEVVLYLYDYLAEVDEEWAHYFVSAEDLLEENPDLKQEGLIKGGMYLDYLNDDSRLTVEGIKQANDLGASIANYVKLIDFVYDQDSVVGVVARDELTGEEFEIKASVVINATGPWSDKVRSHLDDNIENRMYPTKGVHFTVKHEKLPVKRTIYTDTGLQDERMIFIIPRGDKTYFGTTDTEYDINDEIVITQEDVDYLLEAVNYRFPDVNLAKKDIESAWAGLRPLLQSDDSDDPSDVSRGHDVFKSKDGLITIAGGKLTDFRRMALDTFEVVDQELKRFDKEFKEVNTAQIPLSGGDIPRYQSLENFVNRQGTKGMEMGIPEETGKYLAKWYGSNVDKVFELYDQAKELNLPIRIALQVEYALEYEMAQTLVDFFDRRTEHLLFNSEKVNEWKEEVADAFAKRLNWSEEEKEKRINEFEEEYNKITLKSLKEQ